MSDFSGRLANVAGLPAAVTGDNLDHLARDQATWVWDGYLAHGSVTLLTSQWKLGKTTLLSVLLARRETGGERPGRAVAAGRSCVVSEESLALWKQRHCKLAFGAAVAFLCRPFSGKPTFAQWLALIDHLAELGSGRGVDLAVIDALATFLPGHSESSAGIMLESLMPLQRLTDRGMAVLLIHHPRKGETRDGQAARGSGALGAHVDICLEMQSVKRPSEADRRRVLFGYSRFPGTPRTHVIELNAEGTDYRSLGPLGSMEFEKVWDQLEAVFAAAGHELTREEVLAGFAEAEAPAPATLWRWLEQAVTRGLLLREGNGRKGAPFRYWLSRQEEQ
jgi:hypothetical protein